MRFNVPCLVGGPKRQIAVFAAFCLCACSGPNHNKVPDGLGEIRTIGHVQFGEARLHSLADEFDTSVALEQSLHQAIHHVAKHRLPGVSMLVIEAMAVGPDFKARIPWAVVQIDYAQPLKIARTDNALRFISRIRFSGEVSQAAARRFCRDAEPGLTGSPFCRDARAA